MEHEIRQTIPILFYHVWDNLPYPMYNKAYYESCDWFGCISKQTQNIVRNVYTEAKDWQVDYIPHGINNRIFFPIDDTHPEHMKKMDEIKKQIFGVDEKDFVMLYNNRNIRRKLASNIILAWNKFIQSLPEHQRSRCTFIMHTQPIDNNGTDLPTVANTLAPDAHIYFSSGKVSPKDLNCVYNIADVTINMANAEGFGLGTAESLMAGTPIIATVTGGLQDQMRFLDEDGKIIKFNKKWGSNSNGKVKGTHGEWVFPLFPKTRSLTGSPPTPYIFDDFADWEDAADVIKEVYDLGRDERKRRGKVGREWLLSDEAGMSSKAMAKKFIFGIDKTLEKWTPRKRYEMYKI
jgi:glycosyltransferase involved in cell wall biosynthesis